MAVVLALPRLYDAVVARFAADAAALEQDPPAVPPAQPFGWRAPAQQPRGARIVWVPGDDSSGDLGELGPAKQPGRDPARPLATLGELFTVYLEAHDGSAPENERAQYQATRELFDAWWRAVYLAAHGTVTVEDARWMTARKERRFGATLRVLASVEAMVPDAPYAYAPLDTRAVIDVEELDHAEQMQTAEAPEPEPEEPDE
jgi:hypothetical protein